MASNVKHGFLIIKHNVFRDTPFRRRKMLAVVAVLPRPASLKNPMGIKSVYRRAWHRKTDAFLLYKYHKVWYSHIISIPIAAFLF